GRTGRAVPIREHERRWLGSTEPEKEPLFLLRLPMLAQHGNGGRRQRDRASTVLRLGFLDAKPTALGFFERPFHAQSAAVEIEIVRAQWEQLAASQAAGERQRDDGIERVAAQRFEHGLYLRRTKNFDLVRPHTWCVEHVGDVAEDDAPLSGVL